MLNKRTTGVDLLGLRHRLGVKPKSLGQLFGLMRPAESWTLLEGGHVRIPDFIDLNFQNVENMTRKGPGHFRESLDQATLGSIAAVYALGVRVVDVVNDAGTFRLMAGGSVWRLPVGLKWKAHISQEAWKFVYHCHGIEDMAAWLGWAIGFAGGAPGVKRVDFWNSVVSRLVKKRYATHQQLVGQGSWLDVDKDKLAGISQAIVEKSVEAPADVIDEVGELIW